MTRSRLGRAVWCGPLGQMSCKQRHTKNISGDKLWKLGRLRVLTSAHRTQSGRSRIMFEPRLDESEVLGVNSWKPCLVNNSDECFGLVSLCVVILWFRPCIQACLESHLKCPTTQTIAKSIHIYIYIYSCIVMHTLRPGAQPCL